MKLIDSHAHLNFPEFKKDLEEVIKRAKEKGIVHTIVVGINSKTNQKALELQEAYPDFVSATIGFHPHEVKKITSTEYENLEKNLNLACALGEIGLDWVKEYSPKEIQIKHLEFQLYLAKKHNKPVVLHLRGEEETFWEYVISILKNYSDLKFLFHCYTFNKTVAKKICDLGGLISIPGVVTFDKALELKEAVKYIPLDVLLVETDCPFLAPHPMRGKRNEPSFLVYTVKKIAELKGMNLEEVSEKTFNNTVKFFKLEKKLFNVE